MMPKWPEWSSQHQPRIPSPIIRCVPRLFASLLCLTGRRRNIPMLLRDCRCVFTLQRVGARLIATSFLQFVQTTFL